MRDMLTTTPQQELINLVAMGYSSSRIAQELNRTETEIEMSLSELLRSLEVACPVELILLIYSVPGAQLTAAAA